MIAKVLNDLPSGTAFAYIDDVIIPSENQEHLLEQLKKVLSIFRKYNLTYAAVKKMQVLNGKVKLFGKRHLWRWSTSKQPENSSIG